MKGHSGRGISQGRIPELVQSEENMVVRGVAWCEEEGVSTGKWLGQQNEEGVHVER